MSIDYQENILIKNEPVIEDDCEFPESHFDILETPQMHFLDPVKQLQFFREAGLSDEVTESADKPFKCYECGKSFKRKSHLTRHQLLHSGQKPFGCELCSERFTRSENRARHVIQVHQQGSQYECTICQKQFGKLHAMQRHMKMHEIERPHCCNICGNSYTRAHKLAVHKLKHAQPPVDDRELLRKFSCDLCNKRFTRKDHMQRHRSAHAGIKMYECAFCSKRFSRKDNQVKHESACTLSENVAATSKAEKFVESEFVTVDSLPGNFTDVPYVPNDGLKSDFKNPAANKLRSSSKVMPSSKDGAVEIFLVQSSGQGDHRPEELSNPFEDNQEAHIEQGKTAGCSIPYDTVDSIYKMYLFSFRSVGRQGSSTVRTCSENRC